MATIKRKNHLIGQRVWRLTLWSVSEIFKGRDFRKNYRLLIYLLYIKVQTLNYTHSIKCQHILTFSLPLQTSKICNQPLATTPSTEINSWDLKIGKQCIFTESAAETLNSLTRVHYKGAFPSGRVALNVWVKLMDCFLLQWTWPPLLSHSSQSFSFHSGSFRSSPEDGKPGKWLDQSM